MRLRRLVPIVLLLAACADTEPAAEPATTRPTIEATTTAVTEEPTTAEPTEANGPPEECETTPPDTPLAEAIMVAPIPETAVVSRVQEVAPHSDADQSTVDVVVYLCSTPLTTDEHRIVATDIAIAALPEGDGIGELQVGLYMPDGSGGLRQGRTLSVEDYQTYTWDRDVARAPETIWQD